MIEFIDNIDVLKSQEELEKMIAEIPMTKIGIKYNVSSNTIRD